MKLTIVYYLSFLTESLKKSLKSLLEVDDKNIEIIFIDSGAPKQVKDIISTLSFTKSKIKMCYTFENLGHSYGYNLGMKQANGKYIVFAGSKSIFSSEFKDKILNTISKIKNSDILFLSEKANTGKLNKDIDEIVLNEMSLKHFVFNLNFLQKNKIQFENYHHYHNLFIFNSIYKSSKINTIKIDTFKEIKLDKYTYNLYDILTSSEILFNKLAYINDIDEEFKEKILASISISILYEFLYKIYISNKNNVDIINSAINNANNCINKIYPEYKTNKFLLKNSDNKISRFIISFVPNIKFLKKEFKI